jgi:hypothetical protein
MSPGASFSGLTRLVAVQLCDDLRRVEVAFAAGGQARPIAKALLIAMKADQV